VARLRLQGSPTGPMPRATPRWFSLMPAEPTTRGLPDRSSAPRDRGTGIVDVRWNLLTEAMVGAREDRSAQASWPGEHGREVAAAATLGVVHVAKADIGVIGAEQIGTVQGAVHPPVERLLRRA